MAESASKRARTTTDVIVLDDSDEEDADGASLPPREPPAAAPPAGKEEVEEEDTDSDDDTPLLAAHLVTDEIYTRGPLPATILGKVHYIGIENENCVAYMVGSQRFCADKNAVAAQQVLHSYAPSHIRLEHDKTHANMWAIPISFDAQLNGASFVPNSKRYLKWMTRPANNQGGANYEWFSVLDSGFVINVVYGSPVHNELKRRRDALRFSVAATTRNEDLFSPFVNRFLENHMDYLPAAHSSNKLRLSEPTPAYGTPSLQYFPGIDSVRPPNLNEGHLAQLREEFRKHGVTGISKHAMQRNYDFGSVDSRDKMALSRKKAAIQRLERDIEANRETVRAADVSISEAREAEEKREELNKQYKQYMSNIKASEKGHAKEKAIRDLDRWYRMQEKRLSAKSEAYDAYKEIKRDEKMLNDIAEGKLDSHFEKGDSGIVADRNLSRREAAELNVSRLPVDEDPDYGEGAAASDDEFIPSGEDEDSEPDDASLYDVELIPKLEAKIKRLEADKRRLERENAELKRQLAQRN